MPFGSRAAAASRQSPLSIAAAAAFACVTFLLLLRFGSPPARDELDLSWAAVLGWAHAHGSLWGTELVFTFGPLGFITPLASYYPSSFGAFWVAQLVLTLASAVILAAVSLSLTVIGRILLLLLIVTAFVWIPGDGTWFITLPSLFVLVAQRLAEPSPRSAPAVAMLVATSAYTAVLALIKFSLFPLFLMLWLTVSALVFVRARRLFVVAVLAFPAWLLAIWLIIGQPLETLPTFVEHALVVSTGYGRAMSQWPTAAMDLIAVASALATSCVIGIILWHGRRNVVAILGCLMLMATLTIVWRAAVVRLEPPRLAMMLPVLAALVLLASAFIGHRRALQLAGAAVASLLLTGAALVSPISLRDTVGSIAPRLIRNNVDGMMSPAGLKQDFGGQWQRNASQLDLPATRAKVGNATIDIFPHQQGVVLLNEFNYEPRPVFQSYAAYTEALVRLNEAYFLGDSAPSYVLLSIATIDGRMPAGDDALALLALMARYRPVLRESDYLLLELDPQTKGSPLSAPPFEAHLEIPLGEEIQVPSWEGQGSVAFIDARLNLLGRAVSSVLRAPAFYIEVRRGTGPWRRYRLLHATAPTGFLIAPELNTTDDAVALFDGRSRPQGSTHIRIMGEGDWRRSLYEKPVRIGFAPVELPAASRHATTRPASTLYPGFSHDPTAITGSPEPKVEDGIPVLYMHAPAAMVFAPDPGRYRVSATVGILAATREFADCAAADGVSLTLSVLSQGTSLLQHTTPIAPPARGDPAVANRTLGEFPVPEQATVELALGTGGADNAICDWSYLRDVRFDPIDRSVLESVDE